MNEKRKIQTFYKMNEQEKEFLKEKYQLPNIIKNKDKKLTSSDNDGTAVIIQEDETKDTQSTNSNNDGATGIIQKNETKNTNLVAIVVILGIVVLLETIFLMFNFDRLTAFFHVPEKIGNTYSIEGTTLTIYSDDYFISDYKKLNNKPNIIEKVVIKDGVTVIGDQAFYSFESLTDVTIPNSVEKIGDWVFSHCSSLENIALPEGITEIGDGMFEECEHLEHIDIPEGLEKIDDDAFYNCKNLKSISIPNGVKKIGYGAFQFCENLSEIAIPESVIKIGDFAFEGCTGISSITLPSSVIKLGYYVFKGWTANQTIYIKDQSDIPDIWNVDWDSGCEAKIILDNNVEWLR